MDTFQHKQSLKGKHAMTQGKQVLYTQIDVDDAEFVDFEPDAKMAEENAEFEQFKTEMHDAQFDAKITVGKKLTDSNGRPLGRQIFECFECGIDDYTFSQLCTRIREDFGTGLYQVQGRDSKGKYKFKKVVGILAPNKTDNAPAGNNVGELIDKFSDAMSRQQMQTEQMFSKLAGPQTGGDAFDQMTKMMAAMGAMMGAMGIQSQAPVAPKTMLEILTEFKMMKELLGDMGGNSDEAGGGNLMGLLTATVQNIGPLLGAALAQGKQAGTVSSDGIVKPKVIAPPVTEDKPMTDAQKQVEAIKPQIAFLLKQIKGNAEPGDVADFMVDLIPDDQLENVEAFLKQENYFEACVLADSAIEQHKIWVDEWRNYMLSNLVVILDIGESELEIKESKFVTSVEASEMTESIEHQLTPEIEPDKKDAELDDPEQDNPEFVAGNDKQDSDLASSAEGQHINP